MSTQDRHLRARDIASFHLERRTGSTFTYVLHHESQFGLIDRMLASLIYFHNLAAFAFTGYV